MIATTRGARLRLSGTPASNTVRGQRPDLFVNGFALPAPAEAP
jgi:hypothetical protein